MAVINQTQAVWEAPELRCEIWVKVMEEIQPEGEIRGVKFGGDKYAGVRFTDLFRIGEVWCEIAKRLQ